MTDSNDKPTEVTGTPNPIPEDEANKFLAANLKVVDPDVGQTHTCQGVGQDKDRLVFQTEANGNISMYVLPNKFNLDYEKNQQVSGMATQSLYITLRSNKGCFEVGSNRILVGLLKFLAISKPSPTTNSLSE